MAQCQGPALKSEALLKMVATFFVPKIGEDPPPQKKSLQSSPKNQWFFSPNEDGDDQTK